MFHLQKILLLLWLAERGLNRDERKREERKTPNAAHIPTTGIMPKNKKVIIRYFSILMVVSSRDPNYLTQAADLTAVPTDGSLESKPRSRSIQDLYSESEMAGDLKRLSSPSLSVISNLKTHLSPLRTPESVQRLKKFEGFDLKPNTDKNGEPNLLVG